jgi:TolA-binding protein
MNPKVKLLLYVVLLGCMAGLGSALFKTYHAPAGGSPVTTNSPAMNPQAAVTNAEANTNLAVVVPGETNKAGMTNSPAVATAPDSGEEVTARRSSPRMSRMMGLGAAMMGCLVGLALLISSDVSRYLANRVDDFIFNDNLEGVKDPEYEEAERVWASGQHLDSIQLMRDYLKRHPREQYVALRIAEIYEADLHNYLAAALEYEEVLKKRLPDERWGWAAIHLANLYSGKLNKTEQATVLLRRIVNEYGQTGAAKKARERLGLPEPVEETVAVAAEPVAPPPAPEKEPPPSNLPPGFRPK